MFSKQICILVLFTTSLPTSAVVEISNPGGRQLLGHTLIYLRTLGKTKFSKGRVRVFWEGSQSRSSLNFEEFRILERKKGLEWFQVVRKVQSTFEIFG